MPRAKGGPSPEVIAQHERAIRADMAARDKVRDAEAEINRKIAQKVVAARRAGVKHGHLAEVMDLTRDGLTKFLNRNLPSDDA